MDIYREGCILKILDLRTNLTSDKLVLPLSVYTAGLEKQVPMTRFEGFSGHQLLIPLSGAGKFRRFKQHNWDIITAGTVLFIPEGVPHEYVSASDEDWLVGFISFHGNAAAIHSWGLPDYPMLYPVERTDRLQTLLEQVWQNSGADHDPWAAAELLFSWLTELRKQTHSQWSLLANERPAHIPFRESVLLGATKFLQDYMHRNISISQLAEEVGYSQKQLTRLFLHAFQTTPLQYLRTVRLQASRTMLLEHPGLSVSQIARHVGLEPVYFTRIFRRAYGLTPGEFRKTQGDYLRR